MKRAEKVEFVAEMNARLQDTQAVFLTNFRGVNVAQDAHARKKLADADVRMQVVKNRLLLRALEGTEYEGTFDDLLNGPNAVLLTDDPVGGAKALKEVIDKDAVPYEIRGGAIGREALTAEQIRELASLPSREELVGQFASLLTTPLRQFAMLLNASVRDVHGALSALIREKEKQS